MQTLSHPTIGVLIHGVTRHEFSRPEVSVMLLRSDLAQYGQVGPPIDVTQTLLNALLGARQQAAEGDESKAHRGLLTFIGVFLDAITIDPENPPRWFPELCDALLADGYELRWRGKAARQVQTGSMRFLVNGQVAVPGGGQLKVPTPRVDHLSFRAVPPRARASRMRYESPAVTTTFA